MSVGDRYLRLYERVGAVIGYVVIVVICLPITIPLAGIAHFIGVLIALHVAASLGKRAARAWADRQLTAQVAAAPERIPAGELAGIAARGDPQGLVRAIARLPDGARTRWLDIAGDLPHRCGTTVRAEVERQGRPLGDAGSRELADLAGRLEWTAHRTTPRLLAFAPTVLWTVISALALADWPAPGESLFFGLATLFLVIGLGAMAVHAFRDERSGHTAAITPAAVDW